MRQLRYEGLLANTPQEAGRHICSKFPDFGKFVQKLFRYSFFNSDEPHS